MPTAENLKAIAKYLNTTPAYLQYGIDEKSPVSEETEQEKEARKLFNELTDEQKRAIIAIMEQMK